MEIFLSWKCCLWHWVKFQTSLRKGIISYFQINWEVEPKQFSQYLPARTEGHIWILNTLPKRDGMFSSETLTSNWDTWGVSGASPEQQQSHRRKGGLGPGFQGGDIAFLKTQYCLSSQKWYFKTELWPPWEDKSKSFYISNHTGQAQHLLSALGSEKFHIN